jgi:hypothetical protein
MKVYWVQVQGDQNLIYATIGNKNILYQTSDTDSSELSGLFLIAILCLFLLSQIIKLNGFQFLNLQFKLYLFTI